jgi:hypothetical protein
MSSLLRNLIDAKANAPDTEDGSRDFFLCSNLFPLLIFSVRQTTDQQVLTGHKTDAEENTWHYSVGMTNDRPWLHGLV